MKSPDPFDGIMDGAVPKVLNYQEIDRFLTAIDSSHDLLACRFMLMAGLRVAEAINVRVQDVCEDRRAVFISQGKGGKERWAPMDVHTVNLAKIYAREKDLSPGDRFFHLCKRTMQRHIDDIREKAGISWNVTAHTLRHTCATWQLDKGISLEMVRDNLGHTDINITQVYLHLNIRQRSRAYHEVTRFGI
ncbi:MAG: tyrosine-type recombinase/integrase [Thermoplasmatota archaeon]